MINTFRMNAHPDMVAREIGYPIPRGTIFRDILPPFDSELTEPAADQPGNTPPPELFRWRLEHAPRHDVGQPCANYAGILRRLSALPSLPIPRSPADDWSGEGSRLDLVAWVHCARDSFALPRETIASKVPADILDDVYAREFALYPWDESGKRLDEEHAAREHAAREARERAERERIERERMNEKSVGLLGMFAVAYSEDWKGEIPSPVETREDGSRVVLYRQLPLAIPEGRVDKFRTVLPSFYVPPVRVSELQAGHASPGEWYARRKVPSTRIDVSRLRDLRTAEGAHAEGIFKARVATYEDALRAKDHEAIKRFFQEGIRGLLLSPNVLRVHVPTHTPPAEVRERVCFVDAQGNEHEPRWLEGRPFTAPPAGAVRGSDGWWRTPDGQRVSAGEPLQQVSRFETVTPEPRPILTDDEFATYTAQALSGAAAWVAEDELFTTPEEAFLGKWIARMFRDDAWQEVLRSAVENRDHVPTADLEDALRAANLVGKHLTSEEYARIRQLMTEDGWTHRQVGRLGESRPRVWCRTAGGAS